jgi:hypothetical protein
MHYFVQFSTKTAAFRNNSSCFGEAYTKSVKITAFPSQMRILAQHPGGRRQKVWLSGNDRCGYLHKHGLLRAALDAGGQQLCLCAFSTKSKKPHRKLVRLFLLRRMAAL